jgi:peptidoglycan-N-acetylglucosamine deacetylase
MMRQLVVTTARLFPDAIFYRSTAEKIIALTVDDCPVPNDTQDSSTRCILEVLDRWQEVKATFFPIADRIDRNSSIIVEIIDRGHEIANHGTQDVLAASLTPAEFAQHFLEADRLLCRLSQQQLRWYRPGKGFYNRSMVEFLRRQPQYQPKIALASNIPLDTNVITDSPQFTLAYLSQYIFSGAIFVLHGGTERRSQNTAAVLKKLIPQILDRGYRIVSLSELMS